MITVIAPTHRRGLLWAQEARLRPGTYRVISNIELVRAVRGPIVMLTSTDTSLEMSAYINQLSAMGIVHRASPEELAAARGED